MKFRILCGMLALSVVVGATDHERFHHNNFVDSETSPRASGQPHEALTGFDSLTNGFTSQTVFNANMDTFSEVETAADGLGPTYNAQSCRECHQNVAVGGASQIAEQRTGKLTNGRFFDSLGGSLIHSRATYPEIVEIVPFDNNVRTFRLSTNTLGDGYIEAVSNATILAIRDAQPSAIRGSYVLAPVLESDGTARIGRFGWKSQHASLVSFAADAYLNEMGVTSPLLPEENTSAGRSVAAYDPVPDPEDNGDDVQAFADFMRATKAPSRGQLTQAVRDGETVFAALGCAACHVPSMVTAPTGTRVNAGALTVPAALGNKTIHPYSDFLLHDVGTGDGIPIQATDDYAYTANKLRTAPLWGLRTRNRLMHDGLSFTREEAILRHAGQAKASSDGFAALNMTKRGQLLAFLNSL